MNENTPTGTGNSPILSARLEQNSRGVTWEISVSGTLTVRELGDWLYRVRQMVVAVAAGQNPLPAPEIGNSLLMEQEAQAPLETQVLDG